MAIINPKPTIFCSINIPINYSVMAAITSSSQKYERKNVGRRLQIRGFPKIWAEELTFDEIAWWLYDLLHKYGLIDNISVSQSKKDQIIYGVVDMLRGKDAAQITKGLLDENNKYFLPAWNSTLSFLQLDPNNPSSTSTSKGSEENLTEKTTRPTALYNRKAKSPISAFFGARYPLQSSFTATNTYTQSNSQTYTKPPSTRPRIMYSREQILAIRDSKA